MVEDVLDGVPETALWILRSRAEEARRPFGLLDDPQAVRVYEALGGSAALSRFGPPNSMFALRALAFDGVITDFLSTHPHGPVVALGEGLQTSYWRLGSPDVSWYSVDLPEMVAIQRQLLPDEPAITRLAMSALDRAWLDEVPAGPAVIGAEGLFMYLPRDDVHSLIEDLAARFPGGRLVYDSVPGWLSALTMRGTFWLSPRYAPPPMPHAQSVGEGLELARRIPGVADVQEIEVPAGRWPWATARARALANAPFFRDLRASIVQLTFEDR